MPVLPYEDGSFDIVTCTVSFDYLTKPLAVMKEIARVLSPGGQVTACVLRPSYVKATIMTTHH